MKQLKKWEKAYGDGWVDYVIEQNLVETILPQTKWVLRVLEDCSTFSKHIKKPTGNPEEKKKMITKVFADRVEQQLLSFLHFLVDVHRMNGVENILEYSIGRFKEWEKVGVALVQSAEALSLAEKQELENQLIKTSNYTQVEVTYEVVKELIGGLVITMNHQVLDHSIKNKLERMKGTLL